MELIHRVLKEIDDKNNSLKDTGEEVTELRKKIRLLQK
jgi:hypothetical protein